VNVARIKVIEQRRPQGKGFSQFESNQKKRAESEKGGHLLSREEKGESLK